MDQWTPEQIHDAGQLGAADAFARAMAMMENARPSWHRTAPCKATPALFTSGKPSDRAKAFTSCSVSPHRIPCLEFAIGLEDWTPVIYGGTDGAARRQIAKQRTVET